MISKQDYQFGMSSQLYVFETISPTGQRITGSAGLPKEDMMILMLYFKGRVTRMVPAKDDCSRIKVVTPLKFCKHKEYI